MKLIATFTLLAIVTLLAGCMTPMTDEERAHQERLEQERRIKVINTGP